MKCDDEEDGSLSLLGALQSFATVCHVGTNVPRRWFGGAWQKLGGGIGYRAACIKFAKNIRTTFIFVKSKLFLHF